MSTIARFTVADYDRMIEQGIFDEQRHRRIELIYGELRQMTPAGPDHEDVIDFLTRWRIDSTSKDEVRVRVQNSLGIPALDSAPEPDVAWVEARSYRRGRPLPADVLLVIEVAHSSLHYDRGEKAGLYAQAGFQDYWLVNIPGKCLEVFRDPQDGSYRSVETHAMSATVHPLALPSVSLKVEDLFRP